MQTIQDPVEAFLIAASVPREGDHGAGTLEEAEAIRALYPQVARASIYTAAVLGDAHGVREFLAKDAKLAKAPGGVHNWDAVTYLCFSRYLRIDKSRTGEFRKALLALLDAGADAQTGWYETIDQPNPRQILESALYGAAGVAQNVEVTQLLLERGADPNADEETAYHVPESYDNSVMLVLLESGKLDAMHKCWLLVRKADWHDFDGMKMALDYGADPNLMPRWGRNALQHAIQRDNSIEILELLLDRGADPLLRTAHDNRTAAAMAAHKGRGDFLLALEKRGIDPKFDGADQLIAACARGYREQARMLAANDPEVLFLVRPIGGQLLAEFAGNGNSEGIDCLLDLGIPVDARYNGDAYFDEPRDSTALHISAWRGWPEITRLLLARGADVNAKDGRGRTPLQRAIAACSNSYWKRRRSPEWVEPLLKAGATLEGIEIPCGYDEADALLKQFSQ
ncbi:MAG: ankyrin repeat domain-containing protein [Acidobacteriota bacterium]|nr:ankyrin repeat domain-containing protein [Acidobacteriota bacterium]